MLVDVGVGGMLSTAVGAALGCSGSIGAFSSGKIGGNTGIRFGRILKVKLTCGFWSLELVIRVGGWDRGMLASLWGTSCTSCVSLLVCPHGLHGPHLVFVV